MFKMIRIALRISLLVGILSSAAHIYPMARLVGPFMWNLLVGTDNSVQIAEVKLSDLQPADYEAEIETALVEKDPELARSLQALAMSKGVKLSDGLDTRIAEAEAFSISRSASEVWAGISEENMDSPISATTAVLADLIPVGDMRDLWQEYRNAPDYDVITIGFAVAGLTSTAATVTSGLAAAPVKAGVSIMKKLRKMGKLSASLISELKTILVNAIDKDELQRVIKSAKELDTVAAAAAARKILRPGELDKLIGAAGKLGSVQDAQGFRGVMQTVKMADTLEDFNRIEKLSTRYGDKFRAVAKIIAKKGGKFTMRLAEFVAAMSWKLLLVVIWLAGVLFTIFNFSGLTIRTLKRLFTPAMPAARPFG